MKAQEGSTHADGPSGRAPVLDASPGDAPAGRPPGCFSEDDLLRMMRLLASRDPAALAQLYDATVNRVYAFALRVLKDPPAAEEVVSDVYLQVWRTAATYSPERGSVTTWLLMICRSRALDAFRSRSEPMPHCEFMDDLASETAEDPEGLLAATQRNSCVHTALAALAPLPRQLIALAFFRGYTHQEIAASTGLPLGSVKSHIRRGLTSLRAATFDHADRE
ncbi:MAG: sigma-70 family RNA polymerase sigma factor [Tepidisphaeraceae bacterium]